MNPRLVVGLSSLLVGIASIVQTLSSENHRPVATTYFILGIFLFAGKRWAYRGYKFLLWISLILSLVLILLAIGGVRNMPDFLAEFTQTQTKGQGAAILITWMIYSGLVLYYLDTDNVRMEYDIDSKKKKEDKRLVKDQE